MNKPTTAIPELIIPDQPLAPNVVVGTSTRVGGFSDAPWDSLNLGLNGGDDEPTVQRNRSHLAAHFQMSPPVWLNQCHTTQVLGLPDGAALPGASGDYVSAYDAAWTNQVDRVLVVLTADCLPVVIASQDGSEVAVAHAGWRGLAGGILERTVGSFSGAPDTLSVWLGPAIGPQCFEVGDDVLDAFIAKTDATSETRAAFVATGQTGKWLADLYQLARLRLTALGVSNLTGGTHCTFTESSRFFSYRRDGSASGRMGTFVWIRPAG